MPARPKIKPFKKLGQHFLRDERILRRIVDAAAVNEDDLVLEIGSGTGNLTKYLAQKAEFVYAVEKDSRLCKLAEVNLSGFKNVKIICADILRVIARSPKGDEAISEEIASLTSFARNDVRGRLKVVGNLPYYITTPIIFKLLKQRRHISDIIIMVQKEVAGRITAKPGGRDYGVLSCTAQFYSRPEILFHISKAVFFPQPKVDSALLRLKPLEKTSVRVKDEEGFIALIRAAFSRRRKTLLNSLCAGLKMERDTVENALDAAGIDPKRRAETLSLDEFASLARFLL